MRKWCVVASAALLSGAAAAQGPTTTPVRYDLSFDNAVHHEARITVTYRDLPPGPLRLQMSRSSPGRYAIHEFAKNVYSVSARDGAGRDLRLSRTDPYGWTVAGHDGSVSLSYTLFADRADGTYSQIDATHAHLNMPATLMWAVGQEARPVELRFKPFDPRWKVATQLAPGRDAYSFTAPNLQYLMDSPAELSNHELREWTVADKADQRTIALAVHHDGTPADVDNFAAKAKKVVAQHIALFGDVPDFDFGRYTFLADYLPHVAGDGMEHRNSTIISRPDSLHKADFAQLSTLSHEFFHAWNVERLRPAELEPFDFTRANPTPSLWFAEGFTNYYGPLLIRRAGEATVDAHLGELAGALNYVFGGSGRRYGSPQEMSLRAPFVDAATAIDPTNGNIFSSYYVYGEVIALALDLTIRQRFPGRSLDDYMRHLWTTHGLPEKPYTPDDLRTRLGEMLGDRAFADDFFARSISGNELPDFAPLLAQAGLLLRQKNPTRAFVGTTQVAVSGTEVTFSGNPAPGSPLYLAGVERGDRIVALGRFKIESEADWTAALRRHKPGETAQIRFVQRGVERRSPLAFAADSALEVVRFETASQTPTPAQRQFRLNWLGKE